MIGSFSMSCSNFLTSLILSHRGIPVEHRLTTCLPKAFPVFSPVSFSSRCLYSAYILLIISSLTLSTLLCVHLCPNLPLSMTLFNCSRFLCCSILSSGISTTSFHTPSTLAIIFIKCRNQYQMKSDVTLLGRTSSEVFVMLLFFIFNVPFSFVLPFCCGVFIHIFFSTTSRAHPLGFFYTPFYTFSPSHRRAIRDTLFFDQSIMRWPHGLEWTFFTYRRFLRCAPSPTVIHICTERFIFKFYHILV